MKVLGYTITGRFTVACPACGHNTTFKYARTHGDRCKGCVEPTERIAPREEQQSRLSGGIMTTIKFSKDADSFRVENERRTKFVPRMTFFDRIIDQDLLDCAAQAIECAGETITVPSTSYARGLKPRASVRHGVIQ